MDDYMGLENNGEDRNCNTSNITQHQEFYFYMQKSEKGQNRHIFSEHATLQGGVLDI